MAKRYHQSMTDRKDEAYGEGRRMGRIEEKSRLGDEFYAGGGARRRQELEDAGMIYEDHSQIANLPQEVMMKPYPRTGPYMPEDLDDTIKGVDKQMDYDDSQRARNFFPKKV